MEVPRPSITTYAFLSESSLVVYPPAESTVAHYAPDWGSGAITTTVVSGGPPRQYSVVELFDKFYARATPKEKAQIRARLSTRKKD